LGSFRRNEFHSQRRAFVAICRLARSLRDKLSEDEHQDFEQLAKQIFGEVRDERPDSVH
jgi:hypothetical protein